MTPARAGGDGCDVAGDGGAAAGQGRGGSVSLRDPPQAAHAHAIRGETGREQARRPVVGPPAGDDRPASPRPGRPARDRELRVAALRATGLRPVADPSASRARPAVPRIIRGRRRLLLSGHRHPLADDDAGCPDRAQAGSSGQGRGHVAEKQRTTPAALAFNAGRRRDLRLSPRRNTGPDTPRPPSRPLTWAGRRRAITTPQDGRGAADVRSTGGRHRLHERS